MAEQKAERYHNPGSCDALLVGYLEPMMLLDARFVNLKRLNGPRCQYPVIMSPCHSLQVSRLHRLRRLAVASSICGLLILLEQPYLLQSL